MLYREIFRGDERMKLLLIAALIFGCGCAIKDRSYIQLLEAEILVRDKDKFEFVKAQEDIFK